MAGRKVSPSLYFGESDGSTGFYVLTSSTVRLRSMAMSDRRGNTRTIPLFGQGRSVVPGGSAGLVTGVQVVLTHTGQFIGDIMDTLGNIRQYIGGDNPSAPLDMWYSDDIAEYVTADNSETAGSAVTVEFTGDGDFISPGDYLYYPGASLNEMIIVSSMGAGGTSLVADLENNHSAGAQLAKFKWVYPGARLDNIDHTPNSIGRTLITLNFSINGVPLNGTAFPS